MRYTASSIVVLHAVKSTVRWGVKVDWIVNQKIQDSISKVYKKNSINHVLLLWNFKFISRNNVKTLVIILRNRLFEKKKKIPNHADACNTSLWKLDGMIKRDSKVDIVAKRARILRRMIIVCFRRADFHRANIERDHPSRQRSRPLVRRWKSVHIQGESVVSTYMRMQHTYTDIHEWPKWRNRALANFCCHFRSPVALQPARLSKLSFQRTSFAKSGT